MVKGAKIAEKLHLEENCSWPASLAVYCLHPGLLVLCNPDWTSPPLKNLMLNLQDKTFKFNMCKYVAVGDHWNVLVFYIRYLVTSNELRTSLTQNILSHWGCNSRQGELNLYKPSVCGLSLKKIPVKYNLYHFLHQDKNSNPCPQMFVLKCKLRLYFSI